MKIMNVSFSIDVCNVAHVKALTEFMAVLGEHGAPVVTAPAPKPKAVKTEPVEEPQEELPQTPEAEPTEEPQEPTTPSGLTVEMLRAKVGATVKRGTEIREAVKAKLASFGVASVSTLQPENYEAFNEYLSTL